MTLSYAALASLLSFTYTLFLKKMTLMHIIMSVIVIFGKDVARERAID